MRYTFLLYSDPAAIADRTPADWQEEQAAYGAFIGAMKSAGVFIDADWLSSTETATTLSLSNGKRMVQDGPFAETKERLGGIVVVEVADLDAAMHWAEQCPAMKIGKVEIRHTMMG